MRTTFTVLIAALAALIQVDAANAQACAGYPTEDRQISAGGGAHFPEGFDRYGVEASYNLPGPPTLFLEYARREPGEAAATSDGLVEVQEGGDSYVFGAALHFVPGQLFSTELAVCPVGSASVTPGGEAGDLYSVPLGLGFGVRIPAGVGGSVMPFVIPRLMFGKHAVPGATWETHLGVRGGALVEFGLLYLGAEVERRFVRDSDAVLGLRAGLRL